MDDVVVVELRRELCFVDEHVDELAVVGEMRQNFLDRYDLLKTLHSLHPRFPHLGHAAGSDLLEQNVLAESHTVRRLFFFDWRRSRRR